MITISEYARILEGVQDIIHMQTEGLSDSELLVQPPNGGNCMEWVLGHIANGLKTILRVLDALPPENLPDLSRYQRGTEPILGAEPDLLGRERLIAALDMLHAAAQTRLGEMDEAVFDEEIVIFGDQGSGAAGGRSSSCFITAITSGSWKSCATLPAGLKSLSDQIIFLHWRCSPTGTQAAKPTDRAEDIHLFSCRRAKIPG